MNSASPISPNPARRLGPAERKILHFLFGLALAAAVGFAFLHLRGWSQPEAVYHPHSSTNINNLITALYNFQSDNGRFPTTEEGLDALVSRPTGLVATWHGPYLTEFPIDMWGHPFSYAYPGIVHPDYFDLSSVGADGIPDTDDDIDFSAF
jgi:general secretion pathway protein G